MKEWTRIKNKNRDGEYKILTEGCGCCAEYKDYPRPDWSDEEDEDVTLNDLARLEANLDEQKAWCAELRQKLCHERNGKIGSPP